MSKTSEIKGWTSYSQSYITSNAWFVWSTLSMHLSFFLFYFYLFIVRFTQLAEVDVWGRWLGGGKAGKVRKRKIPFLSMNKRFIIKHIEIKSNSRNSKRGGKGEGCRWRGQGQHWKYIIIMAGFYLEREVKQVRCILKGRNYYNLASPSHYFITNASPHLIPPELHISCEVWHRV